MNYFVMTQEQEYKLKKYLLFREYILQYPLVMEQHPTLKFYYDAFHNYLNLIFKTEEMMEESMKLIVNYNLLKEELIKVILSVSRKVTTYAQLEELTDVQGTQCYTYEELSAESDEEIYKKSQNLLQFVLNYLIELNDYGVTINLYHTLNDLSDKFHQTMDAKGLSIETSIVENENLFHLVTEMDHKLSKEFQTISESSILKS